MKTKMWLVVALAACGSSDEDIAETGEFLSLSDDVIVDPSDPPLLPDPLGEWHAPDNLEIQSGKVHCGASPDTLSPKGLTFVIHVSKDKDNAAREVDHLEHVRAHLRARDVFMIEHGSPAVAELRAQFPCNRIHYIAYPDEMKDALQTNDGVEGIAVDWEGGAVVSHGALWNIDRLHEYAQAIHAAGKTAAFVPAWSSHGEDAVVTKSSKMNYELAQIQGSCVSSAKAFASAAHGIARSFHTSGAGVRNVGFEISLDSYGFADNHVGADRAAACTRRAYGQGARAIYIYGNGHDHLPDYLHALARMGVRAAR
jgi:hypothetical protein